MKYERPEHNSRRAALEAQEGYQEGLKAQLTSYKDLYIKTRQQAQDASQELMAARGALEEAKTKVAATREAAAIHSLAIGLMSLVLGLLIGVYLR